MGFSKRSLIINIFSILFFVFCFLVISPSAIYGSSILFSDDFNTTANGNLPNKWIDLNNAGWSVINGEYGIISGGVNNTIPKDEFWNFNSNNIIFDVDARWVSNQDKNIMFHYINESNFYELHYNDDNGGTIFIDRHSQFGANVSSVHYQLINNQIYHFKIELNNTHIKITINSDIVVDLDDGTLDPVIGGKIGLRVGGGTEVWFDNVVVTEIPTATSSPSTSPSPQPTASPSPNPSPSPTPTPSPSPSPSPSSTSIPIKKVFFAPGLGGSWNLDAIINCKTNNYSGTWQLAPFAKTVYQPFFDAIGLTNWKLNAFYYDWRNDVRSNGNLLKSFINTNTASGEKVNFVGHSMGGLVGRSYMESNSGGKLNNYMSVGTPHKGVPYAYPTYSAEVIENNNLIEKIATTILVKHCGVSLSVQNLLPTFDYLKDKKTGTVKPVSTMKAKNNYLPTNFSSPFWGVKVGTLSGTGFSTLKMYETNPPSIMDKLRGNWLDGKPIKNINDNAGDGTVLLSSAQLTGAQSNTIITQSHAGIIGTTEGVNKILDFLGTPPVEDPPFIEPKSALVLIGSNGNFWIKDAKGKTIQSDQGVISIINPKTEDFDFKYIPQGNNTLLIVAQFLPDGDVKYKEYKYKGYMPFSKRLHFNRENPREDICGDR